MEKLIQSLEEATEAASGFASMLCWLHETVKIDFESPHLDLSPADVALLKKKGIYI